MRTGKGGWEMRQGFRTGKGGREGTIRYRPTPGFGVGTSRGMDERSDKGGKSGKSMDRRGGIVRGPDNKVCPGKGQEGIDREAGGLQNKADEGRDRPYPSKQRSPESRNM